MVAIYQSTRRHNHEDWYIHKLNVFLTAYPEKICGPKR
jgi:hypothetical protein